MSAIAAPADRRFRRAHVKPARKRHAWLRFLIPLTTYMLLIALLGYAAYRGTAVVAHARVLQVDRIVVHGNERLSYGDILALLDGLRGESLVWTDLDLWRRRLMASPWIRDAALRRTLPSTVEIVVSERVPVGLGRIDGDVYLVDDRGIVIDEYGPQYADLDLPLVDGLSTAGAGGMMTDPARADLAARVIASLRAKPDLARRLSQIDVSDVHNASVILNGDPAVIYVGEDQFAGRLQSYLELSSALRERVADIDYVDLRFDDRIYVRPTASPHARRKSVASASGAARGGQTGTAGGLGATSRGARRP